MNERPLLVIAFHTRVSKETAERMTSDSISRACALSEIIGVPYCLYIKS